ncbi:C40 family peptidase [Streptomyces drozdowiczii]|uniref:C40 family peptidase n=1 Tax=Streptomyces drozdowiczii TaxID=202862 RepID=A0ABY6PQD1_9ACTN|nr:C40 family peptidase [Streptomyces drozdowiczii]MCX0246037.1 C40 family peptidase [Streptomyces drozdowiczii]UZK54408.1 C40 family peptidase [Streptomyces drozdowiczii]
MSSGTLVRSLGTAALAAVVVVSPATAAAAPSPAPPAPGAPAGGAAALLSELQRLYQQAEEATETYNGTTAELKKRAARAKKLDAALVTARRSLAKGRDAAGQLAREQYQGRSELSAYLRLLLMRDPEAALTQGQVIQRLAAGRVAAVQRLGAAEKRADELAKESRKVLAEQRTLAARKQKDRDTVRTRLKQVEAKIATLTDDQLSEVSGLARKNTDQAQDALVASGALSSSRPPTAQGGQAVQYAVRQIGKPYVWGAEGPGSFDCSGLTSQAWASAGRVIPRTSQEQWRQLTRVPMNALRPGDLVVYFPKATHVALYLGNGLVVQAPRPGTSVKVSPVASNPVLGAVRPDPDSTPLASYEGPELPDGATDGSDEGYGASSAPDA